jgi:putative NADH-flavin reductase
MTTPGLPVAYKAEAEKGAAFLDLLGAEKDLNRTFSVALGPAGSASEPTGF